jgi:hypothetical protein
LPLWKSVWRFLKKLKIELPYDPVTSILSIYSKESKAACNTNTYILTRLWNQSRCLSTDECINRNMIYMYTNIYIMEYHPAIKKNKIRKMDGTWDHHVKRTVSESERQISCVLSHVGYAFLKDMKIEGGLFGKRKLASKWG